MVIVTVMAMGMGRIRLRYVPVSRFASCQGCELTEFTWERRFLKVNNLALLFAPVLRRGMTNCDGYLARTVPRTESESRGSRSRL
jgi:hypothetical protein